MYISKIELNPACNQVRAELGDMYQMHRTLSKAFGDDPSEYAEARCLFRVDEQGENPYILVQSRIKPEWSRLTVDSCYMVAEPMVKQFAPNLKVGQRLAFKLRANPTVKRDGKRFGLYREEEQIEWLKRKGRDNGFEVLAAFNNTEKLRANRKPNDKEATFASVVFEGVIRITDPEVFSKALESGIGSAKGFGFGLLSVAPIR